MTATQKDVNKYISQVKKYLVCPKAEKKQITEDIQSAVYGFVEDRNPQNIAEVYNHFGTPEELAKAHLADVDPKKIKKAINIKRVVVAAVVLALVMFAITMIVALIDNHNTDVERIHITLEETTVVSACINAIFCKGVL